MRIRILFCSMLFVSVFTGNCRAEIELFTLDNRLAAEILPVVEVLLSPDGKAVADTYGNMIIVNDTPEVINEVRTLLMTSDQPVPQVKVQIALDSVDSGQVVGFGKSRKRARHLSTEEPRFWYSGVEQSGRNRSFLLVSSGSSGYIRMARQVPVTDQWRVLFRRHGVPVFVQKIRTIETGMLVSPVAAGDRVIVTVIPRISWMANGEMESFRFVDASTTISVPQSEWVEFGGVSSMQARNTDILGIFLATGDSSEESSVLMRIRADVDN